ncbi:hypothetical protein BT93_J0446 [Corymbia citriodora subsp. variegata]|nr:hypothetical protein BT93_J0446 [Corymbia citriodora subsp. variegata]
MDTPNPPITGPRPRSILMLPWLAHGHISPFLELAKKLISSSSSSSSSSSRQNPFLIFFCSTPVNLASLQTLLPPHLPPSIQFVELHLPPPPPPLGPLPPCFHTTRHLPPHLMPSLKSAFDAAGPAFSDLLDALKPDTVVYDFLQPWAPRAARERGLPGVASLFLPCGAAAKSFLTFHSMDPDGEYPFQSLRVERGECDKIMQFVHSKTNGVRDMDRALESIRRSEGAILINTCREIEGKYVDYLAELFGKEVITVGPLIQEPAEGDARDDEGEIMGWLEGRERGSVVFLSFGSECFLSKEEMEEVARGLELASEEVGFVWVVRFPGGDTERVSLAEALPEGFLERTKDRGMVVQGWAPQTKILMHSSTGGFVTHCGWSSTLEAIVFGVPIIAMPMHLDQPLNAKLVADLGVSVEVRREEGRFRREELAKAIEQVVVQEGGEKVRRRAKELSVRIRERQEEETSAVLKKLEQLFGE